MKNLKKCCILMILLTMIITLSGCENAENNTNTIAQKNTATTNSNKDSSNNKEESSKTNQKNETEIDVYAIDYVGNAEKQTAMPEKGETIAIFHIKNYGDIKVKFFKDIAPKAVENFVTHAKEGYYNGQIFHRVINNFMIQGGDPTGTGTGGKSIWGKNFEDEFSLDVLPYRGALCMANAGTNTNGSQFFIEQVGYDEQTAEMLKQYNYPEKLIEAYKKYGGSMHLIYKHTVFGQVIEGMDVVDKIAATETDAKDKPVNDVVIESIEITEF